MADSDLPTLSSATMAETMAGADLPVFTRSSDSDYLAWLSRSDSDYLASDLPVFTRSLARRSDSDYLAWLQPLSSAFLVCNFVADIYISIVRKDPWSLAFVVSSYATLLLLFCCLRALERAPEEEDSPRNARLKFAVWLLLSIPTILFTYRVAAAMPLPVAVILWAMAAGITLGGSYTLFAFRTCSSDAIKLIIYLIAIGILLLIKM